MTTRPIGDAHEIGVPNLDCADTETLHAYAYVFTQLSEYCNLKAAAMVVRERGDIARALTIETSCDRIYTRLPNWARW